MNYLFNKAQLDKGLHSNRTEHFRPIIVVIEKLHERAKVYICGTCGLGYDDILIAYACEQYHRQYGEPSTDIVKRAIYRPPPLEKARKELTN